MSSIECTKIDSRIIENGFLDTFDHVLVDFDGVLWMDDKVVPGTPQTLLALQEMGKQIIYVTNNSVKDRESFLTKLLENKFPATLENIFCASYCVAVHLQSLNFKKKVYIFGEAGIATELDLVGISSLPVGPDPLPPDWIKYVLELDLEPDVGAVVCGFDQHLSKPKFIKAVSYLKNPECLFIAANKDEIFPTDRNLTIPGAGSYIAAIEKASERTATLVGKPSKFMFDCIKKKHPEVDPSRCLMIGDWLEKDILLGKNSGLKTLLVLTGISKLDEVRKYEKSTNSEERIMIPDYYINSLGDLGKIMNVC